MNPRLQNVLLTLFGVVLVAIGAVVYVQNQTIQRQNESINAILQLLAQQSTQPSAPSLTAQPTPVTPPAQMPLVTLTNRGAFGPQTSPDGKWLLMETHEDQPQPDETVIREHRLFLKPLLPGVSERTILTTREFMEKGFGQIRGKPYPTNWQLAGWSSDGLKVYYATQGVTEGLGGDYPNFLTGGNTLYEVTIADGKARPLFYRENDYTAFFGIKDVYAQKNLMVHAEKLQTGIGVNISQLNYSDAKQVFFSPGATEKGRMIAHAVISPDGKKLMIITSERSSSRLPDATHDYKFFAFDLTRTTADYPGGIPLEIPTSSYLVENEYPHFLTTPEPAWESNSLFGFNVWRASGNIHVSVPVP